MESKPGKTITYDFIKKLNPLSEWRVDEMSLRDEICSELLTREHKEHPDDSLTSSKGQMSLQNNDVLWMYQMIETNRKKMLN